MAGIQNPNICNRCFYEKDDLTYCGKCKITQCKHCYDCHKTGVCSVCEPHNIIEVTDISNSNDYLIHLYLGDGKLFSMWHLPTNGKENFLGGGIEEVFKLADSICFWSQQYPDKRFNSDDMYRCVIRECAQGAHKTYDQNGRLICDVWTLPRARFFMQKNFIPPASKSDTIEEKTSNKKEAEAAT